MHQIFHSICIYPLSIRYGRPHIAQRVANFSLEAMIYLSMYEFTDAERQGRLGILVSL